MRDALAKGVDVDEVYMATVEALVAKLLSEAAPTKKRGRR
jgi:hypothetical protein